MIWYVLGFLLTAALLLIGGMDYAVNDYMGSSRKSDCCLSKGVLLALELLGYDSSN